MNFHPTYLSSSPPQRSKDVHTYTTLKLTFIITSNQSCASFDPVYFQIILMGTPVLRQDNVLDSRNVLMFQGHPCSQDPCQNGGRCIPELDSFICACLSGFSGERCQHSEYRCRPHDLSLKTHYESMRHRKWKHSNAFPAPVLGINVIVLCSKQYMRGWNHHSSWQLLWIIVNCS